MQVPLLDLKAQYATIKDEINQAINEVCESQYFALGPAGTQSVFQVERTPCLSV